MRYEIELGCRLTRRGGHETIEATTQNLSRVGALVITDATTYTDPQVTPRVGDLVQIEVVLPANRDFGQRCLACEAIAVRVTAENGGLVLALQFERVDIRKLIVQPAATGLEVM